MELDYDFKIDIKKGDKIFCKKNLYHKQEPLILSGKNYEVLYANNLWIKILDENKIELNISISVFSSASNLMYYKYFYTPKELRKLKLNKLK